MGIAPGNLLLMMAWADNGWLQPRASILDIGAQELFCTSNPGVLNQFLGRFGGVAYDDDEQHRMADRELAGNLMLRAGFSYASIDYKPYPFGIPLDLNRERLPDEHCGRYDLVTNCGTSEHILNQWNVFETMHAAAAPSELMHNVVPCSGEFEHGIINYNAKFWWALAEANGYDILKFSAWTAPELSQPSATFGDTITYSPSLWTAENSWMNVLFRKTSDRPFAGLVDPAFR